MTEEIKNIVSNYTKVPVDKLQPETVIGRAAVGNSIILHRMYAAIAKAGVEVPGYQQINTFGELMNTISGNSGNGNSAQVFTRLPFENSRSNEAAGVGIDIENVSEMPVVNDFREDEFYTMNFTPQEISYCILQPGQYASFAGLFAAKEAIVKADNSYKQYTFNTIFIDHLPGGKPVFEGFNISISHTEDVSVAVAIKNTALPGLGIQQVVPQKKNNSPVVIAVIAIVIALIAIFISIFK
ncbi:MAG: 4'-phosphopantetheinyl transferase superfamily protein [Ferruginibacter sp.]